MKSNTSLDTRFIETVAMLKPQSHGGQVLTHWTSVSVMTKPRPRPPLDHSQYSLIVLDDFQLFCSLRYNTHVSPLVLPRVYLSILGNVKMSWLTNRVFKRLFSQFELLASHFRPTSGPGGSKLPLYFGFGPGWFNGSMGMMKQPGSP
jgi:hypothetical protein